MTIEREGCCRFLWTLDNVGDQITTTVVWLDVLAVEEASSMGGIVNTVVATRVKHHTWELVLPHLVSPRPSLLLIEGGVLYIVGLALTECAVSTRSVSHDSAH
ncbi:hypothetical protein ACOSQ2_023909 [Xanthoceras sorbifolium]